MPMNYETLKVVLISSSVLSAAIMLTFVTDFAQYVPSVYNDAVSWLKPPYLYLIINCIIITIVASSKLQSTDHDDVSSETMVFVPVKSPAAAAEYKYDGAFAEDAMSNKENEYVVANDTPSPLSARFTHRRNAKASPQGGGGRRVLGVSKAKKQVTLESTWKTITEGRPVPISRHLRKSDTFHHSNPNQSQQVTVMKKSETFNDSSSINSNSNSSSSSKLRKEASLSQDELNRRVEAFINKFNHEMRLQRQHSLNHYNQMVNPASH